MDGIQNIGEFNKVNQSSPKNAAEGKSKSTSYLLLLT